MTVNLPNMHMHVVLQGMQLTGQPSHADENHVHLVVRHGSHVARYRRAQIASQFAL